MKQFAKRGYKENILTPVTLSGVLVPWPMTISSGKESDYKLVCTSGIEYFVVADSDWREVLSLYSWDEVKVVGLLNISNMTLIPQKVFPKGPTGELSLAEISVHSEFLSSSVKFVEQNPLRTAAAF